MPVVLGQKAPDFTVNTSKGPITLSNYRGKWVLLFSHPGDFTPVCTTEFIAFTERYEDFQKLGVELIGLSIDSVFSHIAWIRDIKEHFGIDIPFPIIADIDKEVAREYNLIDEKSGATVRGVFIIDPNQIVRWMIYYPAETGRNIEEIIRVIKALQFNWDRKLATPANWQPGQEGIEPAPTTVDSSFKRDNEQGVKTWYLKFVK
ncbi:hydroperoxide reductase [Thermoplasma volcanium GSS1]|uniref:Peroxiredoxin n=1 Tax=Thermoplasma volcanium (strain ATCC 51530 / DSM 4299 / JCM 9571 / NBRC 15438 / GSS1) TaxID=273116 RepID=TDXH_THEVO|nr:peroxiredoxin [Thermoplasma volcanium]Q979N7.1 RecName: Full=Peroxiredoxin; AltName: Full=Thioredoxin-dependent peroxiredoxin [Thermoplasma volcanium GSS1]BAB60265.1 hydroperoxide reductase [Thermoplasma volcanium GSS1]